MTEEELQSHIQPFLRYALNGLEQDKIIGTALNICKYAYMYSADIPLYLFLTKWIESKRPDDSFFITDFGMVSMYWWGFDSLSTPEGIQKRIDFCKQHLTE